MADLATLLARLERLKSARSSGIFEIRFADRTTRYRNDRELAAAIGALQAEIDAMQGAPKPRNLTVIANKGW